MPTRYALVGQRLCAGCGGAGDVNHGDALVHADVARNECETVWETLRIIGDLAIKPGDDAGAEAEELELRFVGTKTERRMTDVRTAKDSPVLILGDSHDLIFRSGDLYTAGAGLPDRLAYEIGLSVDLIGAKGSGATPVRRALGRRSYRDAAYFKGKKAVAWCLSVREFAEAYEGWKVFDVAPVQ